MKRLEIINVSKHLSTGFHLKNISLDLEPGEIHVLMGENGSGKSTLMKIICGIDKADDGKILFNGSEVVRIRNRSFHRKSIIYIRQDANVLNYLSVAENIYMHQIPLKNRLLGYIDQNKLEKQCKDLIDELNLPFSFNDTVETLGLAQKQILGFCRAYVSDAEIVILDEPSAALTEVEKQILFIILERLKARNTGVFFISHKLSEIRTIGDRISILKEGRCLGTLQLDETDDEEILHLMSGKLTRNRYPKLSVNIGKTIMKVENLSRAGILNDINLELKKGEILGITGLAGSGRTFLAKCLFGALRPDTIQCQIEGRSVEIKSPADAIEHGMALIPEKRISEALIQSLDISSNASLPALRRFSQNQFLDTTLLNRVVFDYFEKFNLNEDDLEKSIGRFSFGSQQKVNFTRWIINRSRIFILDEPTRSLDIPSRIDIYNSMNDLIAKGAGIIFISSDIEEILGMCDRVLVLSDGQFVCNLATGQTDEEEILQYASGKKIPV